MYNGKLQREGGVDTVYGWEVYIYEMLMYVHG
jgi:hypothetical protein